MKNPLVLYQDYLSKDRESINNYNLDVRELRKLNRSGWIHQSVLAPLYAPLLLASVVGFSSGAIVEGLTYGTMSSLLYSIYVRSGMRKITATEKLERILDSTLPQLL